MSSKPARREVIIPPSAQAIHDNVHLAPATRVGDIIWVSGQVGIDEAFKPGEGMEAQARLAFQNLKVVIEAAGADLSDVVELMTFHTDLRGDIRAFTKVKDEFFPERYPSWSGIGVTQLAQPEYLVEIRAIAVAGCGAQE